MLQLKEQQTCSEVKADCGIVWAKIDILATDVKMYSATRLFA